MSALGSFLIRRLGRASAARVEAAARDPVAAQRRKLDQILTRNAGTEYGREHGFESIRRARASFGEYRARVPVVSYDDLKGRIDRVVAGARNVLTAEDPLMFALTSGTTGDPKYIPVTPTCRDRDHSDPMRAWLYRAGADHPAAFRGRLLSMVSPAVEGHTPSGLPYGSTSGHIYRNMPWVVRGAYAIPHEVFRISDYESQYYALMRIALGCEISLLGTANPSSVLELARSADRHADDLLRDLADGTLKRDLALEPELRRVVESRLRAEPAKARRLERARALRSGRLLPRDYWPRLALIGCWKGGTVGAYVDKLPRWFDPDVEGMPPVRDWGYLSSEARGSVPLSDHGSAGVLTVGANVFELVETADVEDRPGDPSSWRFLGVGEVEVGRQYYVFLTTTGGLYRYDINDVVEVVGRYHRTPTIVFKRKGRGVTSLTGEKVSIDQVVEAFARAARRLGVSIEHFKAIADVDRSRYVFEVEAPDLPAGLRRPLLEELDGALCALNLEYRAKRKSSRLRDPLLRVMRPGWHEGERRALAASGRRLFQAKPVLLEAVAAHDDDCAHPVVSVEL